MAGALLIVVCHNSGLVGANPHGWVIFAFKLLLLLFKKQLFEHEVKKEKTTQGQLY